MLLGMQIISTPSMIWLPPSPIISHSLNGEDCAVLAKGCWWVLGGRGHRLVPGRKEERLAPVHPQTPHHFISRRLDSHGASSSPPRSASALSQAPPPSRPPGAFQECKGAEGKGATHVIEHFVQLLGVHDKVGIAYHVVDCVRLGRRDMEDSEGPQGSVGGGLKVGAQGEWPGSSLLRAFTSLSLV